VESQTLPETAKFEVSYKISCLNLLMNVSRDTLLDKDLIPDTNKRWEKTV
jgi:hypothetical protein